MSKSFPGISALYHCCIMTGDRTNGLGPVHDKVTFCTVAAAAAAAVM